MASKVKFAESEVIAVSSDEDEPTSEGMKGSIPSSQQKLDDDKMQARPRRDFRKEDSLRQLQELDMAVSKDAKDSQFTKTWKHILELSALGEILAYVLPPLFEDKEAIAAVAAAAEKERKKMRLMFWKKNHLFPDLTAEQCVDGIVCMSKNTLSWLENRKVALGWVFCVLWALESLRRAFRERADVLEDQRNKIILGKRGTNTADDNKESNTRNPWMVFAATFVFNISFLPVGFFMLGMQDYVTIFSLQDPLADSISMASVSPMVAVAVPTSSTLAETSSSSSFEEDYAFTKNTKYAIIYATFLRISAFFSNLLSAAVKSQISSIQKKVLKFTAKFAIRNPLRFKQRLKQLLNFLRWAKYLAPLIATGNKLLGNAKDLMKKRRQAIWAKKAIKAKKLLFNELTDEERLEKSVLTIQRNYRSAVERKKAKALRYFLLNKKEAAIARVQIIFRRKAAEAKARVWAKKEEMMRLQEAQKQHKLQSSEDEQRLLELNSEMKTYAKQTKERRMLLRPNTTFSVIWKFLFVTCIIIELSQLVIKPKLQKMIDKKTGEPLNLEKMLEKRFLPTPVSEWASCATTPSGGKVEKKLALPAKMFGSKKDEEPINDNSSSLPWYCRPPCPTIQSLYIKLIHFLIHNTLVSISIICFLDVFVTFFTGELNESGTLVPKPFFTRWILPGLILQLLVNPMMTEVTSLIKYLVRISHEIGPARLWRWSTAFVMPSMGRLLTWLQWNVWMKIVRNENRNHVLS